MVVQWCLKGIPRSGTFGDGEALDALHHRGLTANWVRANGTLTLSTGWPQAHSSLSDAALVAHVNSYGSVSLGTPYLSLTAGVIERDPVSRVAIPHSAWTTALDFATSGGRGQGYVFECWVPVPAKPGPELPGFAEEVRDLNLHRAFAWWHHEGEIAAKLVVPPRQIRHMIKFDSNLSVMSRHSGGVDFVPPERISNIRSFV